MRRGTCPSAGGGGACRVAPVVALPTLRSHPRWSPRWGLHGACSLWARSCGPSRTLSPLLPHPAALSSGGVRVSLPGGGAWGGGGGACRLPFVARMSQARRKHDASTGRGTWLQWGGGVIPFGAPIPPRSGTSPASLAGPCRPGLPPFVAVLFPASSLSSPGALVCFVLCFFFLRLHRPPPVSPPGASVFPLPPPHVPSPSPSCPRPFPGRVGEKAVRGGGRPRYPSSGVSTSQARRRHEARHLSLCRGGGRAVWLPSSPFLPCVRTPGAPPAGACTARASYGHGRVVRPAPSLRCFPTLPLCSRGGGGGAVRPSLPSSPTLGGAEVCGGGPCRLPFVARMSQARRKHGAGTRRGTCPSAGGGGGGMPCGSRRRPFYPAFAPPLVPPLGLARRVLSTGTVVWSVPHPLAAASPPCRFVLGGGGGAFRPPYLQPPPLGGRVCVGGGGGRPCRLPFVARTSQARRKHGAGTRRGACPSAGGGGGACRVSPVVAPPTLRAHPRGGWRCVCVGGGGRPCRRPFVARMSQARRKHDASTG